MRAAIFIDGAYLQKQIQLKNQQLNYQKLADYLLAPLRKNTTIDLLRCYFYHCPPWSSNAPTQDEVRRLGIHTEFAKLIENTDRWSLRLGKLEKRRDGDKEYFEQKRVDVLLTCDLVRHAAAGHIQHALLVAGDSDFIPAIIAAKDSGVTLTLWCGPEHTVHKDLISEADEVHYFNRNQLPKLPVIPVATPKNPEPNATATASKAQTKKTTRKTSDT